MRLPAMCTACAGRGTAPGTEPETCADCQGTGELRRVRQSLLGQVVTSVACSRCAGTGEMIPHPCPDCRGEGRRMEEITFTVEVPAGVEHGSTLRLAERGAAGQRGAPNGSLFVHLAVTPDPRFERQGEHLNTTLTVEPGAGRARRRDRGRVARRPPARHRGARHPARPRRADPRPRRAAPARPRPRRPLRPRAGRDADRA